MTENKAAARVLEHPNGQKRELSQTHKNILLHFVRFGKLFAKTCAVVLSMLAAIVADNWALGAWFSLNETEAYLCAES